MKGSHPSLLTLSLLFFVLSQAHSSSLSSLTSAFATQTGEIPILSDSFGLYVEADLSYQPFNPSDTKRMLLGLSTPETLLAGDCLEFDAYNCSQYHCKIDPRTPAIINHLYFRTTEAKYATVELYLDYSFWKLKWFGSLASSCFSNNALEVGKGRSGVIGLGTYYSHANNFIGSKIFSIYLDKKTRQGKLLDRFNASLATSNQSLSFSSDWNWKISLDSASLDVGDKRFEVKGHLLFDLHADAIGIPSQYFDTLIQNFQLVTGTSCNDENYKPKCQYRGRIEDLPVIYLAMRGKAIEIPPQIYLKDPDVKGQTSIELNLKALSPGMIGKNYINVAFSDAIVLDENFMSYYYTVFDWSAGYESNVVKFYVKNQSQPEPQPSKPSDSYLEIILVTLAVLLVVSMVCVYVCKKRKTKKSEKSSTVIVHNVVIQNNVQPLIQVYENRDVLPPVMDQEQRHQQLGYIAPQPQFNLPGYTNYSQ